MKHFKSFIALGILLTLGLAACHKDKTGVYQPKKKIQQIYYSSNHIPKTPYQLWDWNGNQLSSVTHYQHNMKSEWIESFSYDNGRISRVDNYNNNEYVTYEYDGDQLKSATLFYRNTIICTWTTSYNNDKLSKLIGTIYEGFKANRARLTLDPLSGLLPQELSQQVAQREQQQVMRNTTDEPITLVLLLTWDGEHIDKLVFTGDGDYMSFQMEYDDKICPMYGFMGCMEDYYTNFGTGHTGFTKNNVTRMIVTEDHYVDTLCFAYQYDADKYPVLQTIYYADEPDNKMVLYYEY